MLEVRAQSFVRPDISVIAAISLPRSHFGATIFIAGRDKQAGTRRIGDWCDQPPEQIGTKDNTDDIGKAMGDEKCE